MQHQKLPRNALKATPAQIGAQFANSIYPVILSGGSGTRLWPLSRAMYPKQFIRFFPSQPCSFLAATLNRLPASAGFSAPIIIGNNDHRFLIEEEAARAGVHPRWPSSSSRWLATRRPQLRLLPSTSHARIRPACSSSCPRTT